MAKVEALKSRGQSIIKTESFGKMLVLFLGNPSFSEGPDRICFSDGVPVAVVSGGYMYIQDTYRTRAVQAHCDKFAEEEETESDTVVRTSPDNFDFILGSVFTKAGLPLTSRRKDGEG